MTGLGVQVTVPLVVTGVMLMGYGFSAKVAPTLRGLVTLVSWHAPVPVQSPDQLVK